MVPTFAASLPGIPAMTEGIKRWTQSTSDNAAAWLHSCGCSAITGMAASVPFCQRRILIGTDLGPPLHLAKGDGQADRVGGVVAHEADELGLVAAALAHTPAAHPRRHPALFDHQLQPRGLGLRLVAG